MIDYFLFAGEKSGDLHGARLLKKLAKPNIKIAAVAGPQMRQYSIDCPIKTELFEVMGFLDIVPALPRLFFLFHKVKRAILKREPKTVILIDYAEFNMLLAKALRKSGFQGKIIQYICPTVWAWRKNRIHTMAKYLDEVQCILPFEPDCFKNTPLKATYVGHPLLEEFKEFKYDPTWSKKFSKKPILAIFPGSRTKEIKRNLPIQLRVAKKLAQKHNLQPVISCAHAKHIRAILSRNKDDYPIVDERHTHNLMHDARLAIATSGTVNLQLALHGVPTAVTYSIRRLDQFIAQKLLRIDLPYYSLPNIIAQKELYPEFYGTNLKEPQLTQALEGLLCSNLQPKSNSNFKLLISRLATNSSM
ncbi:MAG: lipid-A-disaccharide synthase [Chlamydiales bacterium]|nr:lipid-A-disaccharide synthase [Chlamydiales bacterium]